MSGSGRAEDDERIAHPGDCPGQRFGRRERQLLTPDGTENSICFEELARSCGEWLRGDGPDSDIVISSRVRLARNLAGYAFVGRASADTRHAIIATTRNALTHDATGRPLHFLNVETLLALDAQLLVERQLISRELAQNDGPRGVLIGDGECCSVMINEEDHLRIQVMHSGLALNECWSEASGVDDMIDAAAAYAFHPQLGYLTACPTNVGTGIRVSVMLHLPALRMTREIQKVHQAAQKINLAVRGLHGEGSQAMGDFYQISNQITLGRSEEELIDGVLEVVRNIVEWERRIRTMAMKDNRAALHDQVARACGVLTSARSISSEETMHLLSMIRLGVRIGLMDSPDVSTINELFVQTQPAHLQKLHGETLDSSERNLARATWLRKRLAT